MSWNRTYVVEEFRAEAGPVNILGGVEKVAAAHEAREAVGRPQRHTSRANEVDAALMHYLATEEYREHVASSPATDGGEWRLDSYKSS